MAGVGQLGRRTDADIALATDDLEALSLDWDPRDTVVDMVRYLLGSGYPRFERDHVRRQWARLAIFTPNQLIEAVNRGIDRCWTQPSEWWHHGVIRQGCTWRRCKTTEPDCDLDRWIEYLAERGTRRRAYTAA